MLVEVGVKREEGREGSQDRRVGNCGHEGVKELGETFTPQLP